MKKRLTQVVFGMVITLILASGIALAAFASQGDDPEQPNTAPYGYCDYYEPYGVCPDKPIFPYR